MNSTENQVVYHGTPGDGIIRPTSDRPEARGTYPKRSRHTETTEPCLG